MTTAPMLGDTARDIVTGFEGIVTGQATYITGCTQLLLAPRVKDDGSRVEAEWFDIDRLTVAGDVRLTIGVSAPGPDKAAPKR